MWCLRLVDLINQVGILCFFRSISHLWCIISTSLLDNIDKVDEIKKSKKEALIIKFICCYLYSQLPISSILPAA